MRSIFLKLEPRDRTFEEEEKKSLKGKDRKERKNNFDLFFYICNLFFVFLAEFPLICFIFFLNSFIIIKMLF
ncbi:hypothetical protein BJ165DRAFT_1418609 [Panaeolus papilionaceus]|nr:hypothetical protein BJ165DRAFT_1418609 [Panaeolus papilionaceus]